MAECIWLRDEICVNADCPMRADFCPVPDIEGVCRYEERPDVVAVVRCKDCIGWTTWLKTKEPSVSMCGLSGLYVGNHRDDLFCPYGERREEDAAD